MPVVTVPAGKTVAGSAADIKAVYDSLRAIPTLRVVDYSTDSDPSFITTDGRTTFGLVYEPQPNGFVDPNKAKVDAAFAAAVKAHGLTGSITGYELLSANDSSGGPSILTETLLGALGALAVLAFVFASLLALVPLLIAAVSILSTFLIVLLLTYVTNVSFVVQFLIALVGLGVAIDYSLLVVSRWREEIAHGHTNEEAVRISVRHAGHAVFASGVTVAISLVALVVVPVPLLRSMGFGGMLIPLCSVAVVLTLLPALLASVGRKVDVPHIRKEGVASKGWTAWARTIVKRPWLVAAVALVILGFAIAPLRNITFGDASTQSEGTTSPAAVTLASLNAGGVGTRRAHPDRAGRERHCRAGHGHRGRCRSRAGGPYRGRQPGRKGLHRHRRDPQRRDGQLQLRQDRRPGDEGDQAPARLRRDCGGRCRHRRLSPRCLRQLPVRHRADRGHHVHPAGTDVPVDPAAAQGCRPQPDQPLRRHGCLDVLLAGGARLARGVRHRARPGR